MSVEEVLKSRFSERGPTESSDLESELAGVVRRVARRRNKARLVTASLVGTVCLLVTWMVVLRPDRDESSFIVVDSGTSTTTVLTTTTTTTTTLPTPTLPIALKPTSLPKGLQLRSGSSGGRGGSQGSGRSGTTRSYIRFDAARTRAASTIEVRALSSTDSIASDVRGKPQSIRGKAGQVLDLTQGIGPNPGVGGVLPDLVLEWAESSGLTIRVEGTAPLDELLKVSDGLRFEGDAPTNPEGIGVDYIPTGFEHWVDYLEPTLTGGDPSHNLEYRNSAGSASLSLRVDNHSTEDPRRDLLWSELPWSDARLHTIRGGKTAVYKSFRAGMGEQLRWLEAKGVVVELTAGSFTESELLQVAEGLVSVSSDEVARLGQDLPGLTPLAGAEPRPLGSPDPSNLRAIAPEVAAGKGEISGKPWQLIVYEVAPAEGRSERRFCSELRSDHLGPQTCFPIDSTAKGISGGYAETLFGSVVIIFRTDPTTTVSYRDESTTEVREVSTSHDPSLPIEYGVVVVPLEARGHLEQSLDGRVSSQAVGLSVGPSTGPPGFVWTPPPDGVRSGFSQPNIPGSYPELLVIR